MPRAYRPLETCGVPKRATTVGVAIGWHLVRFSIDTFSGAAAVYSTSTGQCSTVYLDDNGIVTDVQLTGYSWSRDGFVPSSGEEADIAAIYAKIAIAKLED